MIKARLVHIGDSTRYETKVFPIDKDIITIGRLGDVELPSEDWVDYVGEGHDQVGVEKAIQTSREHARILRQDDKFVLEDVGSKVGTYVNGEKLGNPHKEPWKVRFCHSPDYYPVREPKIRENNRGSVEIHDEDIITLGEEMYQNAHAFRFEVIK